MQLTLLTPLSPHHAAAGRPAPSRRTEAPSREAAALSQLDQIAASNLRSPGQGLGATAIVLAVVGGLVLLGSASMWRTAEVPAARSPVTAIQAPAVTALAPAPVPAPAVKVPSEAQPQAAASHTASEIIMGAPDAAPPLLPPQSMATSMPEPMAAAAPVPVAVADDAAHKARAKQAAEARRKVQLAAQERLVAAEAQRQQTLQRQQREAEIAQEQARQRAAAEAAQTAQTAQASRATAPPVAAAPRSVRDLCTASGNFLSENFCLARECRKSEHRSDAVCVGLREMREGQQRLAAER